MSKVIIFLAFVVIASVDAQGFPFFGGGAAAGPGAGGFPFANFPFGNLPAPPNPQDIFNSIQNMAAATSQDPNGVGTSVTRVTKDGKTLTRVETTQNGQKDVRYFEN